MNKPQLEKLIELKQREVNFWKVMAVCCLVLFLISSIIFIGQRENLNSQIREERHRVTIYQEGVNDCFAERDKCVPNVEYEDNCIYVPIEELE